MPEFNEFRQPNAMAWKPEVPGTWLAYESQDAQRMMSVEAAKPAKSEIQPVMDVTSTRPGDSLNFSKDENGYFCFKVSGDDNYARHYFGSAQKWARLETIDASGHRALGPQYDLELQRKNVDQWLSTQKPVEAPPDVAKPTHLDVTPAFKNPELEQQVGKPLLPDEYNHWANVTDSMKYEFGKNQLSVLNMFAGLADKTGFMIDQQIQAMENYINGTRNPDPKLRLQLAVMDIASAAGYLIDKDSSGKKWVFSVTDGSQAGRKLQKAIDQLDLAVASSDSLKMYADYGRTNNQARNLKAAINFVKVSLDTGALKFLNGCSLPELLP